MGDPTNLFQPCHTVVQTEFYIDMCKHDMCMYSAANMYRGLCNAIAAYAYECATSGVVVNWKTHPNAEAWIEHCGKC